MKNFRLSLVLLMALSGINSVAGAEESEGDKLFSEHCGLCHRQAGTGTFMLERRLGAEQSILEEREDLTAEYASTIVRWGIGSMPRFSRGEISDDELDLLLGYLLNSNKTSN